MIHDVDVLIREYPNAHGRGMAVTSRGKVIGAQLPIWQMQLICILVQCSWVVDWAD